MGRAEKGIAGIGRALTGVAGTVLTIQQMRDKREQAAAFAEQVKVQREQFEENKKTRRQENFQKVVFPTYLRSLNSLTDAAAKGNQKLFDLRADRYNQVVDSVQSQASEFNVPFIPLDLEEIRLSGKDALKLSNAYANVGNPNLPDSARQKHKDTLFSFINPNDRQDALTAMSTLDKNVFDQRQTKKTDRFLDTSFGTSGATKEGVETLKQVGVGATKGEVPSTGEGVTLGAGAGGVKLSRGQESLDAAFGKEIANFDFSVVSNDLDLMTPVVENLELISVLNSKDSSEADKASALEEINQKGLAKNLTGFWIGVAPDFLKKAFKEGQRQVDAEQLVRAVVQRNLRPTLGAQFAEKEGERVIKTTFDAGLPEKFVSKRVRGLRDQMMRAAQEKKRKIDHWNANGGTLSGYVPQYIQPRNAKDLTDRADGTVDPNGADQKEAAPKFEETEPIQ